MLPDTQQKSYPNTLEEPGLERFVSAVAEGLETNLETLERRLVKCLPVRCRGHEEERK